VYRIGRDGGTPEFLARGRPNQRMWNPCWLPDGRTVLFSHHAIDLLGIMRVDTQTKEVSPFPGGERFVYPMTSPRGDVVALSWQEEGIGPSWLYSAASGRWEPAGEMAGFPSWSSDSEWITSISRETRRILRWSRVTRKSETIADLEDMPLLELAGYPWMGVAPDGSPLVVRDRSTRDLYALDWEAP